MHNTISVYAHTISSHRQGVSNRLEGHWLEEWINYFQVVVIIFFKKLLLSSLFCFPPCVLLSSRAAFFLPSAPARFDYLPQPPKSLNLPSLASPPQCLLICVFHLTCKPLFPPIISYIFCSLSSVSSTLGILSWNSTLNRACLVIFRTMCCLKSGTGEVIAAELHCLPPWKLTLGKPNKKEKWKGERLFSD